MLGTYGLDDEEALLDALAKSQMADQRGIPDGTVGPTPEPMDFPEMDLTAPADPMAKLPALTPLPGRVDLTKAREADAQSRIARGFETAARQAIGGLTLTKPVDAVTPEGTAEQTALADEARTRGDVLETRKGEMLDRQKALAALLRPPAKAKTPEELALERQRTEAGTTRAKAYEKSVENTPELAREKMAAEAERRRLGAAAATRKAAEKTAAAAEKARLAGEKQAKKDTEGLAFGYEIAEGANPDKMQREKHAGTVKSANAMKGLVGRMRGALKGASKADLINPMSAKHLEVAPLLTALQLEAKNVAELGALSGPDMGLMQRLALDPTSVWNIARDPEASLSQLEGWSDNTVKSAGDAIGIFPKKKTEQTATVNPKRAAAEAWLKANTNSPDAPAVRAKLEAMP